MYSADVLPNELPQVRLQLNETIMRAADAKSDLNSLNIAKVVAIVVLIVVTTLCGISPYLLNRFCKWTSHSSESVRFSVTVQCLLYFGAGVLLCTTFVHMLPDVIDTVHQLQECHILASTPFALAEILMCTGFYLMYMLEEIMHVVVHYHQKKLSKKEAQASAAFERGHSTRSNTRKLAAKRSVDDTATESTRIKSKSELSEQRQHDDQQHMQHMQNDAEQQHAGHSHTPIIAADTDASSSMRGLGIILALSLHELFEGMAIGLEMTVVTVWFMLAAVAAHKLVLAFCVGLELLVSRTRIILVIIYLFTFSIVTPIGIGIGIAISHQANPYGPSLPSGILQGIATGTLLYVVFFEIFSKNVIGWLPYVASLAGFALMFGLQILSNEVEGDDTFVCY